MFYINNINNEGWRGKGGELENAYRQKTLKYATSYRLYTI